MLFTFAPPRSATFYMGEVTFPIDLVFVGDDGCVGKVVRGAQPGAKERWSMERCAAVIEVPAGTCVAWGVRVGLVTSFNPTRHIVEADESIAPGDEGYYQSEPAHERPPGRVQPGEVERDSPNRFEDRKLPDEAFSEAQGEADAMPHWDEAGGYNSHEYLPDAQAGEPGGVRMSASLSGAWFMQFFAEKLRGQWHETGGPSLNWRPVAAQGMKVEAVEVTPDDIRQWVRDAAGRDRALSRLRPEVMIAAADAFTSPDGLRLIQAALESSGVTDRVLLIDGRMLLHGGADPRRTDDGLAKEPL
jgi:hypothetical protein